MAGMNLRAGYVIDPAKFIHIFGSAHVGSIPIALRQAPQGVSLFQANAGIISNGRMTIHAPLGHRMNPADMAEPGKNRRQQYHDHEIPDISCCPSSRSVVSVCPSAVSCVHLAPPFQTCVPNICSVIVIIIPEHSFVNISRTKVCFFYLHVLEY